MHQIYCLFQHSEKASSLGTHALLHSGWLSPGLAHSCPSGVSLHHCTRAPLYPSLGLDLPFVCLFVCISCLPVSLLLHFGETHFADNFPSRVENTLIPFTYFIDSLADITAFLMPRIQACPVPELKRLTKCLVLKLYFSLSLPFFTSGSRGSLRC